MDTLLAVLIGALVLALMVRGPKTLPLIGGMFGRGVREARKEAGEIRGKRGDPANPADQANPDKPSPPAPPAS